MSGSNQSNAMKVSLILVLAFLFVLVVWAPGNKEQWLNKVNKVDPQQTAQASDSADGSSGYDAQATKTENQRQAVVRAPDLEEVLSKPGSESKPNRQGRETSTQVDEEDYQSRHTAEEVLSLTRKNQERFRKIDAMLSK